MSVQIKKKNKYSINKKISPVICSRKIIAIPRHAIGQNIAVLPVH